MKALLLTSLYAAVLGLFIGALYDVVRILRVMTGVSATRASSRVRTTLREGWPDVFSFSGSRAFSSVFTAVTDVVFLAVFAATFVLFLYCFNYGRFRWFILASTLAGFRLYYLSVGRVIISVSGYIANVLKLVLNSALFLLIYPFRALFKLLLSLARKTVVPLAESAVSAIDKRRSKRYTLRCMGKINDIINGWVDV